MRSVMADNHRSVIGDITHGPYQRREADALARASSEKRKRHKLRAQFIFDASTRVQLKRIACHKGCSVASLIKEWAASAERRIIHQLGQGVKAITW
jgi:hypothetical protein